MFIVSFCYFVAASAEWFNFKFFFWSRCCKMLNGQLFFTFYEALEIHSLPLLLFPHFKEIPLATKNRAKDQLRGHWTADECRNLLQTPPKHSSTASILSQANIKRPPRPNCFKNFVKQLINMHITRDEKPAGAHFFK